MASIKNMPLTPGVSDLGLGDQLVQSVQDDDEERKKKLMAQANGMQGIGNPYGGLSPAVASMMPGRITGL